MEAPVKVAGLHHLASAEFAQVRPPPNSDAHSTSGSILGVSAPGVSGAYVISTLGAVKVRAAIVVVVACEQVASIGSLATIALYALNWATLRRHF